MIKILNCSLNVWKETPFWILFEDYTMKKEVDRAHVDLKRIEKYLRNKVSSWKNPGKNVEISQTQH